MKAGNSDTFRAAVTALLLMLLLPPSVAGEDISADDSYTPPPPAQRPLLETIEWEKHRTLGLLLGAAGIAGGVGLSIAGTARVAGATHRGFDNREVQGGILLVATGGVVSGLFALILDYFLEKPKDQPEVGEE